MRGGTTQPILSEDLWGTGGLRFNSCHVAVHRNRLDSATGLWSTGRVNACDGWGMAGLALTCLPSAEDLASTWRYPMLEAVPGKTGRTEF